METPEKKTIFSRSFLRLAICIYCVFTLFARTEFVRTKCVLHTQHAHGIPVALAWTRPLQQKNVIYRDSRDICEKTPSNRTRIFHVLFCCCCLISNSSDGIHCYFSLLFLFWFNEYIFTFKFLFVAATTFVWWTFLRSTSYKNNKKKKITIIALLQWTIVYDSTDRALYSKKSNT